MSTKNIEIGIAAFRAIMQLLAALGVKEEEIDEALTKSMARSDARPHSKLPKPE